jgi:hypothetical protein
VQINNAGAAGRGTDATQPASALGVEHPLEHFDFIFDLNTKRF